MTIVTATARNRIDPTRWVSLTIGLRDRRAGEPFVQHASDYNCNIQAADVAAQSFTSSNWESGIISGAGYAWRRWLGEYQGLSLKRLHGVLGGEGIEGIADATAAAFAKLANLDAPSFAAWDVRIETDARNGQSQPITSAASSGA